MKKGMHCEDANKIIIYSSSSVHIVNEKYDEKKERNQDSEFQP